MNVTLLLQTEAWVIALVLFILMLCATWLGLFAGNRVRKSGKSNDVFNETTSLTALLFFLLAFTFGMSGSRFETRRTVVIEEANDIGTALLRTDLYKPEDRAMFRSDFKDYVEARISYYAAGANPEKILAADSLSQIISSRLWARAAKLSFDSSNFIASQQMIPALNTMIDITTTRLSGEKARVPESIIYMLFFIAVISSFYGGYTGGRKGAMDWLVQIGFCLLVALVILFTLDLDRPRRGFVNLDSPNQSIIDLRKNF